jgi:hypothetical protein
MYGYVLQDWLTIRGGSVADIIQGESTWMGFSSFQDIVFWLDVREITWPTGGTPALTWYFETAPSKDNNLFQSMTNVQITQSGGLTPGVQLVSSALPSVILAHNPSVPLGTWVRWRVSPAGSTAPWDATFRVLVAANRVVRGAA